LEGQERGASERERERRESEVEGRERGGREGEGEGEKERERERGAREREEERGDREGVAGERGEGAVGGIAGQALAGVKLYYAGAGGEGSDGKKKTGTKFTCLTTTRVQILTPEMTEGPFQLADFVQFFRAGIITPNTRVWRKPPGGEVCMCVCVRESVRVCERVCLCVCARV
jgi:hypothetical protein